MYLKKVNRNYSFRYRVPSYLRDYFGGRTEIVKSLQTKNARIAKQKAHILGAELSTLIAKAKIMIDLDIEGVDRLVSEWLNERLEADLNGRINKSSLNGYEGEMPNSKVEGYTELIMRKFQEDLGELKTGRVEQLASSLISEQINEHDPLHKRLMFQMMRANVELFQTLTKRNKGEFTFDDRLPNIIEKDDAMLTYAKAVEVYSPVLLQKTKRAMKKPLGEDKEPKQYVTYTRILQRLLEHLDKDKILPNRASDCQTYLNNIFVRKDGTVARDVAETLKAFYTWLKAEDYIKTDIAKQLYFDTLTKSKRKAFTPDMTRKILTESKGDINLFFKLYLYTGMRRGELFNMEIVNNGFKVLNGKTKSARRFIPRHHVLNEITDDEILGLISRWNVDYIGRTLNDWITENISTEKEYTLHSSRHSFNTALVTAGVSSSLIKSLMGHEENDSTDMTEYYTTYHEIDGDKDKAINLVKYI